MSSFYVYNLVLYSHVIKTFIYRILQLPLGYCYCCTLTGQIFLSMAIHYSCDRDQNDKHSSNLSSQLIYTFESREVADFVVILCSTEQSGWKVLSLGRTHSAVYFLNKLKHNSLQRRKVSTKHLATFTLYTTDHPPPHTPNQTAVANYTKLILCLCLVDLHNMNHK